MPKIIITEHEEENSKEAEVEVNEIIYSDE